MDEFKMDSKEAAQREDSEWNFSDGAGPNDADRAAEVVLEKERDEIGTTKEENQFNFGAGERPEMQDWKHPGEWQYEEDGMVVTRTSVWSAPGCHEGCGVLVYSDKDTGRFIKVEGDPDDPYNRGALCPRCLAFKQV